MNIRKTYCQFDIETLYLLCTILIYTIFFVIFIPDENSRLRNKLENIMINFDKDNNNNEYDRLIKKNKLRIDTRLFGKWCTSTRYGFYNEIQISRVRFDNTRYIISFSASSHKARYTTSRYAIFDEQTGIIYLDKSLVCIGNKQAFNSFRIQYNNGLSPNYLLPIGYIKDPATTFLQEYMAVYKNINTPN
jgi:hypothetical protein